VKKVPGTLTIEGEECRTAPKNLSPYLGRARREKSVETWGGEGVNVLSSESGRDGRHDRG